MIEAGDGTLPESQTGSAENPARWSKVVRGTGATAEVLAHFMGTIVNSVQERSALFQNINLPFKRERFVSWDNLTSHNSPIVQMAL